MSRTLRYRPAWCRVWSALVDPQVSLDDLDGDRCRSVRAETAALDDDADGYRRVGGGREAGEDRVVKVRAVAAVLGRAGLASDLDAGHLLVGRRERGAGRVMGHRDHYLRDLVGYHRADRLGQHRGGG